MKLFGIPVEVSNDPALAKAGEGLAFGKLTPEIAARALPHLVQGAKSMDTLTLEFNDEEWAAVNEAANLEGKSVEQWCKDALAQAAAEEA